MEDRQSSCYGNEDAARNHGKPWLANEQLLLMQEVSDRKSLFEIASTHCRTIGSIRSRILQMAECMKKNGESVQHIGTILGTSEERMDTEIISSKGERNNTKSAKRKRDDECGTENHQNISNHMVVSLLLDLKSKLLDLERGLEDIKKTINTNSSQTQKFLSQKERLNDGE